MDDEDWGLIAAEQRREISAAKELDADLAFAYQLQFQEAVTASISLHPSSSSPPEPNLPVKDEEFLSITDFQYQELLKMEQEFRDRKLSESEFNQMRDDLHRRMHDERVAAEIKSMPEYDWEKFGDNFEKPFYAGEEPMDGVFRVYFKGSTLNEYEGDDDGRAQNEGFGGVGVAICDAKDQLLFELAKPVSGNGLRRVVIEFRALIEGLNIALELDLKRVVFYCHYHPLFQYVTRQWVPRQPKVAALLNQVAELQAKFTSCNPHLIAGNDVKFVFKLARDALMAQVNKPAGESSAGTILYETCAICLEDRDTSQIFSVDGCRHRYCYLCMKQHVEVKMLSGIIAKCPHESCYSELNVDSCTKFLTPMLVDRMKKQKMEASIPVTERVYCPYPTCSVLMSLGEARAQSTGDFGGRVTMCVKCRNPFCMVCKVPWHNNMTCAAYKNRYPNAPTADLKLKNLAATKYWRQCKKCNHMIELATGCYHITCRCGSEFCYTCGAEWRNKKATCSCPLWDEGNIMDED